MAGAICCSWCYCEILAAATWRKQTLGQRERRPGSAFEDPRAAAGGGGAESLQGGRWEGSQEGERVQDGARCESERAVGEYDKDITSTSEIHIISNLKPVFYNYNYHYLVLAFEVL